MDLQTRCAELERQNEKLERRNIEVEKQLKEVREQNRQLESVNENVLLENKYLNLLLHEVRESKDLLKLNTELLVLEIQNLKMIEADDQLKDDYEVDESNIFHPNERKTQCQDANVESNNGTDFDSVIQNISNQEINPNAELSDYQDQWDISNNENVDERNEYHQAPVNSRGGYEIYSNHTVDEKAKRFNRGVSPLKNKNDHKNNRQTKAIYRRTESFQNHTVDDYSLKSQKSTCSKKYAYNSMNKYIHWKRNNFGKRRPNNTPLENGIIETLGLKGLKNIGNTCFMNSVIQCLSNTRWLLEYLKNGAYFKDINTSISTRNGNLIESFAEVIKELWSDDSSVRVVNTISFKNHFQRFATDFNGNDEQDAHEFLRYLLDGLHEDTNRKTIQFEKILPEIDEISSEREKSQESWSRYLRKNNSRIVDHFAGQLKSTLTCTFCHYCSVTFDQFWGLSLPIIQGADRLSLTQCLDEFTKEERLDGNEKLICSKCKEKRKFTKSLSIDKFPKILMIHLKRFSQEGKFLEKLSVSIDFPLEGLDMSNYADDNVTSRLYKLYAICNHNGTLSSGHYTAFCRHPYEGIWHEYNDSSVSPISSKSLVSEEAYVLFYELDGTGSL